MLDSRPRFSGAFFNEIIAAELECGQFDGAAWAGLQRGSEIARKLDSKRSFLRGFLNEIIWHERDGAQSEAWPPRRRGEDCKGFRP
jgi:hypothetical protein